MNPEDSHEVLRIADTIKPLLSGHRPELQGGVLAELLALWLAGHRSINNPPSTDAFRERLLAEHIQAVRELTALNSRMIDAELQTRSAH